MLDVKTKIRLQGLEKQLNEAIRGGDFPYLGHYSHFFYDTIKESIASEFHRSTRPLALYLDCLNQWPAVFATYLVQHVAEGYGAKGTFEVYPYIEKALHSGMNTPAERETLWARFRAACLRLGLSISPRKSGSNYMIEEYLRQSGVPLNYLDDLVGKMIRYSENSGLPDDDDPEAIKLWCQGLLPTLRYLPKPVQKAIEADTDGFYVRLFSKAINGRLISSDESPEIERRLIQAVNLTPDRESIRKRSLAIPKIVLRDSQLGVELPSGEDRRWKIEVDGELQEYAGSLEAKFVPLSSTLPLQVAISDLKGSCQVSKPLWEDDRNNRLLIFSENGNLVGSGQLGQEKALLLEPGEYDLLLRFQPRGLEEETHGISDSHELYYYHLSLDPGQIFELVKGPAKICFHADTKPVLTWDGQKLRGVHGNELYASQGLSLGIKIPRELFFDETTKYLAILNPGELGNEIVVSITADSGTCHIDLSEHCASWRPGLTRLLVELKREGFQRAEARTSIFLWNGLERVSRRTNFHCSRLPNNLLLEECDNVKIDTEKQIVTFKNEDQRFFRMIFAWAQNRKQSFTWSVPGIFQQILDYQEHATTEKPIKKGSTLAVSTRSREVLEIFSSSNGTLQIGTLNIPVDFDRVGRKRLPLNGLVDYLGPGADVLCFIDHETQVIEELVRLVAPHQLLDFRVSYHSDKVTLKFSTKEEVELVALQIKDMISGWKKECILICGVPRVQSEEDFSFWLSCQKTAENLCQHELQLFLENWPNGAWIITFEGRIKKRWGRFSNLRGDHFALGMPVINQTVSRSADPFWKIIKDLDDTDKESIFKRVHRRLLNCYASQAWETIEWLGALWSKLAIYFAAEDVPRKSVITLAEEIQDESNAPSWVPMFSILEKFPKLYAQPAKAYQDLPNKRQVLSLKCLNILANMKYGVLPLVIEDTLNNRVMAGFSNFFEMQQGAPPRKFLLQRYGDALKQALDEEGISSKLRLLREHEWQPGDGDYLGALHYRFVEEKLLHSFRASLVGNEFRRGKALNLCRHMQTIRLSGAPEHLNAGVGILDLKNHASDEDVSVEEQHIEQISRFLSHFARACRWEVRHPGTLNAIRDQGSRILGDGGDYDQALGYLLCLGKDLFMFYLLLWEAAFKADVDNLEVQ